MRVIFWFFLLLCTLIIATKSKKGNVVKEIRRLEEEEASENTDETEETTTEETSGEDDVLIYNLREDLDASLYACSTSDCLSFHDLSSKSPSFEVSEDIWLVLSLDDEIDQAIYKIYIFQMEMQWDSGEESEDVTETATRFCKPDCDGQMAIRIEATEYSSNVTFIVMGELEKRTISRQLDDEAPEVVRCTIGPIIVNEPPKDRLWIIILIVIAFVLIFGFGLGIGAYKRYLRNKGKWVDSPKKERQPAEQSNFQNQVVGDRSQINDISDFDASKMTVTEAALIKNKV